MKQYNIYSNYDGKHELCGIIHCEVKDFDLHYRVEIIGDKDRWDFPVDLLGIHRDWGYESQPEIIRWLESRVVPKNRMWLDKILESVGLKEWDLDALLKLNKGKVCDDSFSVEIVEAE